MEHPNARLIRELYEARNDASAIRSLLHDNVLWHEPELESEHMDERFREGA